MVREASEGLDTDDVFDTAVDKLDHFSCQEPALTGFVSDAHDGLRIFDQIVDAGRRIKVLTLFVSLVDRTEEGLDGPDPRRALHGGLFAGA